MCCVVVEGFGEQGEGGDAPRGGRRPRGGCRRGLGHMHCDSAGPWQASASCRLRKGCPGAMSSTRTIQSWRGVPRGLCAWAAIFNGSTRIGAKVFYAPLRQFWIRFDSADPLVSCDLRSVCADSSPTTYNTYVSTLFPGGRGLAVVARRVERAAAHRDLHRGAPGPGTGRCRAWCGHRSRGANAGLAWALGGEACRRTLGARRPRRRSTLAHRACAMARGCLRKGALGSSKKAVPGPPRTIPILVNPGIGRAGCPRRSTSDWPRSVDSVHPFPPSFSPTTTTRWVSRREEWCAAL